MKTTQLQNTLQTAVSHHQAGRLEEAERLYRQLRSADPKLFDAWHLGGVAALQRGRMPEAVDLLTRALRIDPRSAICTTRLGLAFALSGRHEEAIRQYKSALRMDPKAADAWANLGTSMRALGHTDEAIGAYLKALEIRPDYPEALDLAGALIADTKGMQPALPYFKRATELNGQSASAWCNLGLAQSHMRQYDAALDSLAQAAKLDPKASKPLIARALVEQQTYRLQDAAASFDAAIARDPLNEEAHSGYLLTQHYLENLSAKELFEAHLRFGRAMTAKRGARPTLAPSRDRARPLRVAFLSPDLRRHAVAYFLLPLLENASPEKFEVILYHDHANVDDVSRRLMATARIWRNFAGQAHDVVEKQIRADAPDVLVDLSGHTGVNRLALFARRLAPTQITYLGYPNTTGLAEMDYRLTDAICDPEEAADAIHTEKLIRFSNTAWAFQPPPEMPKIDAAGGVRPFTFGCFNNYAKISDHTLELWSRILRGAPTAHLSMKGQDLELPGAKQAVEKRLNHFGIDPTRVRFAGRTAGMAAHLACYQQVDVSLDPYPYHGTTTTCEALLMGVPVITRLGMTHVSRVGGSLLRAAGHSEWIAETDDEYVRIAVEAAGAGPRTTEARLRLREDMEQSLLLDHPTQAARFWQAIADCV